MRLYVSNVDVLSSIISLVSGYDVLRLMAAGNKAFSAKLLAAAHSLQFEVTTLTPFPFSAFDFPNLRELDIHTHNDYYGHPVQLNGALPVPPKPMNSVHKIRFTFAQSFTALCGPCIQYESTPEKLIIYTSPSPVQPVSPMTMFFPNLRTLILEQSATPLVPALVQWAETLPPTLTELHLRCLYASGYSTIRNDYRLFSKLPKNLETLVLTPCSLIEADPVSSTFDDIVWPPNLTKLICRTWQNASILWRIPSTMKHLDIDVDRTPLPAEWLKKVGGNFYCSSLPRGLVWLSIGGLHSRTFKVVPDSLPPGLETFSMDLNYEDQELCSIFPKTITSFHNLAVLVRFSDLRLNELFPKLRSFSLYTKNSLINQHLPPQLESLYNLEASCVGVDFQQCIPRSVTYLGLKVDSALQMSQLPPRLTRLDFCNGSQTFTPASFKALPPTLRDISFSLSHLSSVDCIASLPRTLDTVALQVSRTSLLSLTSDPLLLIGLPPSLKSILISITSVECEWHNWLYHCVPLLPALTSCVAVVDEVIEGSNFEDQGSLMFMNRFCPSLRELGISISQNISAFPNAFKELPSGLHTLMLMPPNRKKVVASDCMFDSLPESLTTLSLDEITGITPKILEKLPPKLLEISITDSQGGSLKNAIEGYKLLPKWEGYSRYRSRG